jgi:hypothetical protein
MEDGERIAGIKKFDFLAEPPFTLGFEYITPLAFVVKSEFK